MKKIAVVGSGISGLSCAYLLKEDYDVHLFENESRLGGHTNTLTIDDNGVSRNIDTGFIVFNDWNYPNFFKLIERIGLPYSKTEMSFSVHNTLTHFEYNGHTLGTLFSQRSNLLKPKFWRFLSEITRFNKLAKEKYKNEVAQKSNGEQDNKDSQKSTDMPSDTIDENNPINETLLDFLDKHEFSDFFRQHYILPMGAAIWSISLKEMESFPLHFFIRFFYHHGLLNISHRPQWYVVNNGSKSYISKLTDGVQNIHLSSKVTGVSRPDHGGVKVSYHQNGTEKSEWFDDVIMACHSDQALKILEDANEHEIEVLGNMRYQNNEVVLHQDASLMPNIQASWASWNYRLSESTTAPACVTYYMNKLQNLPKSSGDFFVTLNQTNDINPDKIIKKINFSHPVFDINSMKAQQKRALICGQRNTHFCGAYWYNGFHEDGLKSALDVCKRFGVSL